jgi:hypothetical protein
MRLIQILHRDVAQGSRAAAQLLDEIMAYPGQAAAAGELSRERPHHPPGVDGG